MALEGLGDEDVLRKRAVADDETCRAALMLVDLGEAAWVEILHAGHCSGRISHIRRYSHVMHLVSTTRKLSAKERTALDA